MTKHGATIVEKAVAKFIRALEERNASAHTIKAYRTDLAQFAEYVGPQGWRDIDHVLIRGYLANLYERGLSKTSVARALAALRSLYQVAGAGGRSRAESCSPGRDTRSCRRSCRACRRSKK